MDKNMRHSFWDFKGQADYVDKWFLLENPYLIILITVSYLLFVLKIGPAFMKNRRPMKMTNILVAYNFLQVIYSTFLTYIGMAKMMKYGVIHSFCLHDHPDTRKEILEESYWYFLAKVSELLDTIFFVLRKKQNQVSFLHVYHHTLVVVASWILMKYSRTDDLIFTGTLNSFVHIVMYTYYGLSTFPMIAKHLWWKKYLTKLQLVQFMLILIYFPVNMMKSKCSPSLFMLTILVFNVLLFIYLFSDFYRKSYVEKHRVKNNLENSKNGSKAASIKVDKINKSKWSR